MIERLRQSIPTGNIHQWWECGWQYIMPDFDKPDHSIVEWSSEKMPVYPIQSTTEHSALGLRSPIYGEG